MSIVLGVVFGSVFLAKKNLQQQKQVSPGEQPVPVANASTTIRQRMALIPAVLGCWVGPTCILAIFVALSGGATREWNRIVSENGAASPEVPKPASVPVNISAPAREAELAANRPAWINDDDLADPGRRPVSPKPASNDVRRVVLMSKLWSTEEEANQELESQTGELVRSDFERRHGGFLDPTGHRFLTDARAVETAVKERYVERTEQDFGKFSSPMNRVWWQVELSPLVRTEIYPAWKAAVVENRVIAAGSALAALTLLANSIGLFARLKRNANSSTVSAAVASTGCAATWVVACRLLTSHLLS